VTIVAASLSAKVVGKIAYGCLGIRFGDIVFPGPAAARRRATSFHTSAPIRPGFFSV
jgi:hypothetical protein